jgi:hypothetical protein
MAPVWPAFAADYLAYYPSTPHLYVRTNGRAFLIDPFPRQN